MRLLTAGLQVRVLLAEPWLNEALLFDHRTPFYNGCPPWGRLIHVTTIVSRSTTVVSQNGIEGMQNSRFCFENRPSCWHNNSIL
jgi:hypothetical protein